MSFNSIKPRSLFTIEDDGLIQRLDFSDCDDIEFPSNKFESPVKRESSPIRRNRSSVSPSDDERLDSSTDSAMGDLSFSTIKKPAPRRRLTKSCQKLNMVKPNSHYPDSVGRTKSCQRVNAVQPNLVGRSPGTTPPYRGVRALRLFGSPQSPKTLLKQSQLADSHSKSRIDKCPLTPKLDLNHNIERIRRSKPFFSPGFEANINPFTQNSSVIGSQIKRRRDSGFGR